jgi:ribosomal protein L7/L12
MDKEPGIEKMCRDAIGRGASLDEVVQILHSRGASILASIKAIRAVYSISLGEAKQVVSRHPAWRAVVRANEPLHDVLEEVAKAGRK